MNHRIIKKTFFFYENKLDKLIIKIIKNNKKILNK